MGLLHEGIAANQKRHHQHQQQRRCHNKQYRFPNFSGPSMILHIRLYHSLTNSGCKVTVLFSNRLRFLHLFVFFWTISETISPICPKVGRLSIQAGEEIAIFLGISRFPPYLCIRFKIHTVIYIGLIVFI